MLEEGSDVRYYLDMNEVLGWSGRKGRGREERERNDVDVSACSSQ